MNTALNRTSVALLTNKSGGSVAQGDVVIVDSTTAASFTTTTTSAYVSGSVGVVLEPNGIASNAIGSVAFGGYVPIVNLSGSASLGDLFKTHTVAKQAVRHAAPIVAGDFGQVLGTGTTPAAFLWGQPSGGGGGGSTTLAADTDVSISGPTQGQILGYNGSVWANVGGMQKIAESVLGAPATSVTLSSIPSTYKHLRIIVQARSDRAAQVFEGVDIQFNADTGSNYDSENADSSGTGSTWGGQEVLAGTAAQCASITGASAPAGVAACFELSIPNYAGTTFNKEYTSTGAVKYGTASGNIHTVFYTGHWRSTAAINAIKLLTRNGSNFLADTTISLYGLS